MQRLGREWRRQALVAVCAAALVPTAVVIAALTLDFREGGIPGLGALDQVLSGPRLPDADPAGAGSEQARTGLERRLRAVRTRPGAVQARRGRGGGGAAPGRSGPRSVDRPGGGSRPPARPSPGGGRSRPGGSPAPAGTPAASGAPAPRPRPTPGPVRSVGDQVRGILRPVPVAGPVADELIGKAVDQIEPMPPRSRPR